MASIMPALFSIAIAPPLRKMDPNGLSSFSVSLCLGLTFSPVAQEGLATADIGRRADRDSLPRVAALPNGKLGAWNGGLLMGVAPPIVVGSWTYSLLDFAQSGPHFSFVYRNTPVVNLTTAAVRAKGEAEFFGPLLPTRWKWFAENGGWGGVANLARGLNIEVGGLRWRTEGLVCLKASAARATLVTKPVRIGGGSDNGGGAQQRRTSVDTLPPVPPISAPAGCLPDAMAVIATINCNCTGGAHVSLLSGGPLSTAHPIAGYSGVDAAEVPPNADGTSLPLVFGNNSRGLPLDVWTEAGVRFRVLLSGTGAELFGITLRCEE